ncbi:putative secreted protein [Rubellimicrobium thermophilum DSM 16684]|uniref:Putative secreted protein n=1 Tax=Rubellimicrobium thermophilum DSM 16684 TaxID=1123069 RepID=S9SLF3_9RHOB|nr:DUF1223 domain-containing protein [Rubellimicrobium thermophilum]EPX87214.1 putative secreted protein [Rubellimicrobium thermophilum DSM 16684]
MRLLPAMGLAAVATLTPAGLRAEEPMPVVVELYTSQGCSSCPPADAMLEELARMDGVIALALHVDYWDYIGWPDSFASPLFSARQEAYAKAAGERMVYTPQVIVNGQDRVVGSDAMAVMARLHAHAGATTPIALRLAREGGMLRIEAESSAPLPPLAVQLVRYRPSESVTIDGGENAGLTMTYANIVTAWEHVGDWDGNAPLSLLLPLSGEDPVVVLLQEHGPGRIRAAARMAPPSGG